MMIRRRLVWYILIRLAVVTLYLAATAFLHFRGATIIAPETLTGLFRLIGATYLFSLFSLIGIRLAHRLTLPLTYVQIVWDLLLVTVLILLTGGITSPYSYLYLIAIINASVLLARRDAIYTASLGGILYGAILDLQYYGKLEGLGLEREPALQLGSAYILTTLFANISAYYLAAFLTGYLAERAQRSESALKEKVVDYEELERLNSFIVSNLDSGLLTVNNEGRIRVFNRYAEELTGISQRQAYDTPLESIFPSVAPYLGGTGQLRREEMHYRNRNGNTMVFGFKTVPFTDKNGDRVGVIINFRDLTTIKRMEDELKRADRLAAIGELSARIAHEIRNPLAAISGSVQLLAGSGAVDDQDRRLLDIVQREAERLNRLIGNFLAYARPIQPAIAQVALLPLFTDLATLLRGDPRFTNIRIEVDCPDGLTANIDQGFFHQLLLNLLMNAAEAFLTGGTVRLAATPHGDEPEFEGMGMRITVADNGPGIPAADQKRIFEPFFTTKAGGSGLGLATVYRIVEYHGGRIYVDSVPGVGTSFTIYLPSAGNSAMNGQG